MASDAVKLELGLNTATGVGGFIATRPCKRAIDFDDVTMPFNEVDTTMEDGRFVGDSAVAENAVGPVGGLTGLKRTIGVDIGSTKEDSENSSTVD